MLLVLSDDHREHLRILTQVESAVVGEFGRIAIEFLRKGSNPKVYEGAARKLEVSSSTIQQAVEGLTYLLTESSKLMVSEIDFQDSVLVLGFTEELNKVLLQLYLDNRKEIRQILSELEPDLPHYHNLEWRLDVQEYGPSQFYEDELHRHEWHKRVNTLGGCHCQAELASRSLRHQVKPTMTMKLHLKQNDDVNTSVLQTDPATLIHIIQELEQALAEMKTNHCRRIVRNIK